MQLSIETMSKLAAEHHSSMKKLTETVSKILATQKRDWARQKNRDLDGLHLDIEPVPVYEPGGGVVYPLATFFPKTGKDFYALQDAKEDGKLMRLDYLLSFYKIPYCLNEFGSINTRRAVRYLENILSLQKTSRRQRAEWTSAGRFQRRRARVAD